MSIRLNVTVEMGEALKEVVAETGMPLSAIVRNGIARELKEVYGREFEAVHPAWGGKRKKKSE